MLDVRCDGCRCSGSTLIAWGKLLGSGWQPQQRPCKHWMVVCGCDWWCVKVDLYFVLPAGSSKKKQFEKLTVAGRLVVFHPEKRASPSGAHRRASPAKVARKGGEVVSVCGQLYTSLSWFLKKDSPSATQCARARTRCANSAVVLCGGHARAVAEYASVPQTGQALRPLCTVSGVARKKLGSAAVPTEVDDIMIFRAPDPLPSSIRLSQVLFLVSELEKCF